MIKNDLKLNKHYLHEKSNNIYELLLLTNINLENKNFIPTAVYKDIKTNVLYSRPIIEFIDKFVEIDV